MAVISKRKAPRAKKARAPRTSRGKVVKTITKQMVSAGPLYPQSTYPAAGGSSSSSSSGGGASGSVVAYPPGYGAPYSGAPVAAHNPELEAKLNRLGRRVVALENEHSGFENYWRGRDQEIQNEMDMARNYVQNAEVIYQAKLDRHAGNVENKLAELANNWEKIAAEQGGLQEQLQQYKGIADAHEAKLDLLHRGGMENRDVIVRQGAALGELAQGVGGVVDALQQQHGNLARQAEAAVGELQQRQGIMEQRQALAEVRIGQEGQALRQADQQLALAGMGIVERLSAAGVPYFGNNVAAYDRGQNYGNPLFNPHAIQQNQPILGAPEDNIPSGIMVEFNHQRQVAHAQGYAPSTPPQPMPQTGNEGPLVLVPMQLGANNLGEGTYSDV